LEYNITLLLHVVLDDSYYVNDRENNVY